MKCPFCHNLDSRVIDSRVVSESNLIRRRRECEHCQRRFTTFERVEEILPLVVKKDQSRQDFDRIKLLNGIKKACEKRPVAIEKIERLVADIERTLQEKEEKEIASTEVGKMVMDRLREIDHVAYVRFASVYRSFKDISEFMDELKGLLDHKK